MKLRNLIFILFMSVLFLFTVVPAQAVPIWGSDASAELNDGRTSDVNPPGGVVATRQWEDGGFTIAWNIVQLPSLLWSYTYTVTADTKEVSHFILEVTEDNNPFNIYGGTSTQYEGPKTWDVPDSSERNPSNPLMPNPIFGVKFDFGSTEVTYTMVTDRAPVYGVFYADDGKDGGQDVVAWSNALNYSDYKTKETDLTFTITDFIVRPDSMGMHSGGDPIPEPATLLLLGSGLIGIAVSGKKKFKKRNG